MANCQCQLLRPSAMIMKCQLPSYGKCVPHASTICVCGKFNHAPTRDFLIYMRPRETIANYDLSTRTIDSVLAAATAVVNALTFIDSPVRSIPFIFVRSTVVCHRLQDKVRTNTFYAIELNFIFNRRTNATPELFSHTAPNVDTNTFTNQRI